MALEKQDNAGLVISDQYFRQLSECNRQAGRNGPQNEGYFKEILHKRMRAFVVFE
jgi:hypothetical protein